MWLCGSLGVLLTHLFPVIFAPFVFLSRTPPSSSHVQVARKWLQAPVLGCRLNAISFICELATRAQQDAASVAAAVKAGGQGLDPGLLSPLLLRTSSSNVQEVEGQTSAVSSFSMDAAASTTVVMAWPALDDVAAIVKAWDLVPGIFDPPTGHRALVERAEPVLSCLGRRDGLADTELLGTFFVLRIQRVHTRMRDDPNVFSLPPVILPRLPHFLPLFLSFSFITNLLLLFSLSPTFSLPVLLYV